MPGRRVLGELVARALEGSWRAAPPPLTLDEGSLARAAPLLVRTGAAGLAWRRVHGSGLEDTPPAAVLRDAFRLQTLDARLHEGTLARAVSLLRSVGVEPVVAKGWAAARLYPRAGLRPYGDHDLLVAPEAHAAAAGALREAGDPPLRVDLHAGLPSSEHPWPDVVRRAPEAAVGDGFVRVLAPEDHLAFLCLHLLRHGAWRPVWLCDVAVLLETRSADFDWTLFQGARGRRREARRIVLLLARRVLGADLGGTPLAGAPDGALPAWMVAATLKAWGAGGHYTLTTRMALARGGPAALASALRARWPNAIEASVRWGAPLNRLPRLPVQVLDVVARLARFTAEVPEVRAGRAPERGGEA